MVVTGSQAERQARRLFLQLLPSPFRSRPTRGRAAMPGAVTSSLAALAACLIGLPAAPPAAAQQVCDTSNNALSSPTARFQDNGDGTVTDKELALMWMRCASGQQWQAGHCAGAPRSLNWLEAKASAEQINRQGAAFYSDWRVPSLRELATLSERQCKNPRINLAVFPDTPAAAFWTATLPPGRSEDKAAFAMDFGAAGVQAQDKQDSGHVRLVRNAQ